MHFVQHQVFLIFIYGLQLCNGLQEDQSIQASESLFADVIKNITRVNNVLEDLIKNYEKLQKIYRSQETFESDKEKDDLFKTDKKFGVQRVSSKTTKRADFHATPIFEYKSENSEEDFGNKPEAENVDANLIQEKRAPKIEFLTYNDTVKTTKKKQTTTKKSVSADVSSTSTDESSEEENTKTEEKDESDEIIVNSDENTMKETTKGEMTDQISIEMQNSLEYGHNSDINPKGNIIKGSLTSKSVRYSIPTKIKNGQREEKPAWVRESKPKFIEEKVRMRADDNKRQWKKIIYAEKFLENNIWDDIFSNKPVNLTKEKELLYSKRANVIKLHEVTADKNKMLRKRIDRRPLLWTCPKTELTKGKNDIKNKTISHAAESNEELLILKEQFKTGILRKAYGDACLRVVIRKCYKACKEVPKNVCSHHKCSSKFKETFKNKSKTGCIQQFQTNNSAEALRHGQTDFMDDARARYLEVACLPPVNYPPAQTKQGNVPPPQRSARAGAERDSATNQSSAGESTFNASSVMSLNILRDRFERACQKLSSEKCTEACKYAVEESCADKCKKKKKDAFKKECKRRCKASYRHQRSSDKSSDSSGSSGSTDSSSSSVSNESKKKKMETKKRTHKIVSSCENKKNKSGCNGNVNKFETENKKKKNKTVKKLRTAQNETATNDTRAARK